MRIPDAAPELDTIAAALFSLTVDRLRDGLRLLGLDHRGTKSELHTRLFHEFGAERLPALLERLEPSGRLALAQAAHFGAGRHDPARFRALFGDGPRWYTEDARRGREHTLLALFFYEGGRLPKDLAAPLRALLPAPPGAEARPLDAPPATVERERYTWKPGARTADVRRETLPVVLRETATAAPHNLHVVLQLIDQGKVAVSATTQRPSEAAMRAIGAALEGGDFYDGAPAAWAPDLADPPGPIQAFAWPLLAQAARFAQLRGSRLELTRAGAEALAAPPADTLRAAWTRWVKAGLIDEFSRIDRIKGQGRGRGKGCALTRSDGRRTVVVEALAACPPERWLPVDEFFRFMQAAGRSFDLAHDAWKLYIGEQQYGSMGFDGHGTWEVLQGRYVLCLLLEYAATAGLIDVALVPPAEARDDFSGIWGTDDFTWLSRYDGLLAFRINAFGAWCLGQRATYAPAPLAARPVLQVLPNHDIVAVDHGGLTTADRMALDGWCVRASDHVWRLDAERLLERMQAGRRPAELREFLTARGRADLPQTVEQFLADVESRALRLRDAGMARLVECADEALAAQLTNAAATRDLCRPAGVRHIAIPAASEPAFRRAVRRLGMLLPASSAPASARKGGRAAHPAPASGGGAGNEEE
ncbi:MAG: hypothetical protein HZA54_05710 [Planctomycetes bacterium]|nr:hypothetical protein [Planctomycetota bacterium]